MGNTSMVIRHSIRDKFSGELMAIDDRQMVFMDAVTRKSVVVPPRIAKYFDAVSPVPQPARIQLEDAPETAITVERRAQFSDYDFYYHIRSNAYAAWCLDAAADAGSQKKLHNFTEDIAVDTAPDIMIGFSLRSASR